MTVAETKEVSSPVLCRECGQILTSSRSIRLGIGQRCMWKTQGRKPRSRTTIEDPLHKDVPFTDEVTSTNFRGSVTSHQTKITDWDSGNYNRYSGFYHAEGRS